MMSMEMNDSSDLLTGRRAGGFKNYWYSRTVLEQALLVLAVLETVMVFGFVIGVASLTNEINSKDAKIHHLATALEECKAGTTESSSTSELPTDTAAPPTDMLTPSSTPGSTVSTTGETTLEPATYFSTTSNSNTSFSTPVSDTMASTTDSITTFNSTVTGTSASTADSNTTFSSTAFSTTGSTDYAMTSTTSDIYASATDSNSTIAMDDVNETLS